MADKIGIAVTSTPNRAEHLQLCLKQIYKFHPQSNVFVNVDYEGVGVAQSKNNCLMALKDCDYIFLFDDDCFPIKEGWVDFFIEAHKASGDHHFLYLNRMHNKIESKQGVNIYKDCGGCFMFLTKEVIQKVGGFYSKYGKYGYEHAGYTQRIFNAGLNPSGRFISLENTSEYLFAFDFDINTYGINHKPSLPMNLSLSCIKENEEHYKEDIKEICRPI